MAPPLLVSKLIIYLIRSYQMIVSPLLGSNCRFQPTCSQYSIEAINKFGALKGSFLILKRLIKCHPFKSGGKDPIPLKNFDNRER